MRKKYFNTRKVAYNLQISTYEYIAVKYGINEIEESIAKKFPALFEPVGEPENIEEVLIENDQLDDSDNLDDTQEIQDNEEGINIDIDEEIIQEDENDLEEIIEEVDEEVVEEIDEEISLLDKLTSMNKDQLIEFAESNKIDVDKRKGEKKIREFILQTLAKTE